MATAKQTAANRRNAKKSTGPKTEAGKSRSKSNATKHVLTAETVVLTDENQADFDQLSHHLRQELAPQGELEKALVDRVAVCLWRLKRARRIEAEIFEIERLREAANEQQFISNALMDGGESAWIPMFGEPQERPAAWYEARDRKRDYERSIAERSSTAGRAYLVSTIDCDSLGKLYRYEVMIERSLHGTLEHLERLQAKRQRLTTGNPTIIDVDPNSVT